MYDAPTDLSPHLQKRIAEDRAQHKMHPARCDDADVIRRRADQRDEATLWRPAFVRDSEKIVHLPAYNRLAGKTQVFSLRQNDDISRRGLHVQLVSRVARDIGAALGLNCDLIEAIALGHDIGHAPFGHAGERALDRVAQARLDRRFMHNVHGVRVLDRMYPRNISLQTLDGVLCHNGEYEQRVFQTSGIASFAEFDRMVADCEQRGPQAVAQLHPMTLEGCVVRLSDIIAYVGKDRQDAVTAGLISEAADGFDTGAGQNAGLYNAWVLQHLTIDVVEHSYGLDHIEMSQEAFAELSRAKKENYRVIYESPQVEGIGGEGLYQAFLRVFDRLVTDLEKHEETSPIFTHHVAPLQLRASYYDQRYDWAADLGQTVVDYIASMTDSYFVALYRNLFGSQALFPSVGYFGLDQDTAASDSLPASSPSPRSGESWAAPGGEGR